MIEMAAASAVAATVSLVVVVPMSDAVTALITCALVSVPLIEMAATVSLVVVVLMSVVVIAREVEVEAMHLAVGRRLGPRSLAAIPRDLVKVASLGVSRVSGQGMGLARGHPTSKARSVRLLNPLAFTLSAVFEV